MLKKLNELGYTKVELLIVIILLGVVAFITINRTSYAFKNDTTNNATEIKKLIELQAEDYAEDNLDIFNESSTTYITVNDLVEEGYMLGNDLGLIIDPSDNTKNFNENKVKLEYDEEKNVVNSTFID